MSVILGPQNSKQPVRKSNETVQSEIGYSLAERHILCSFTAMQISKITVTVFRDLYNLSYIANILSFNNTLNQL